MVFGWLTPSPKKSGAAGSGNSNLNDSIAVKSRRGDPGFKTARGCTALVTGSSGLCGARLVEMLLERGAKRIICFDRAPPSPALQQRFDAIQAQANSKGTLIILSGAKHGDLTSDQAVEDAFKAAGPAGSIDVCFHIGALVGPFYDQDTYMDVNYRGTVRVIANCRKYRVPKLVYSSSPSTRFTGSDVTGQREEELPMPNKWLAMYAEAKAYGEMAVVEANDPANNFMTIAVAPHQIYGPHDNLFLPNLLETAGNGRLRIFGKGQNKISVCYVDNYAHGLMCGADALYKDSPALAKFYIITDGEPVMFWKMINTAIVAMGFVDLTTKFHLPVWLLYMAAYIANVIGWISGKKLKLNPFNVKMLIIHRYFSIENAVRDLHYEPVVTYEKAWPSTIAWFKQHWLPTYLAKRDKNAKTSSGTKKVD